MEERAIQTATWEPTLREAWVKLVESEHRVAGRAESTLRNQRTHLRAWEEWDANHHTYSMTVRQISRQDLKTFRAWLQRKLAGITGPPGAPTPKERAAMELVASNVNNHLKTLRRVLKSAEEEGLIQHAPGIDWLPASPREDLKALTVPEVSAIYRGCACAEWPDASPLSVLQWRTAIVMYAIYGFRTQELIRYEREAEPLRWSNLCFQAACPGNDGRTRSPHGWLKYVPPKQRLRKPLPVIVPLAPDARRHLDAIRDGADDDRPVFRWPCSPKLFDAQWEAIVRVAAAELRGAGVEMGKVLIKHLRKTAHTWHKDVGGQEIADRITGHAPRGVSQRSYDVPYGRLAEHFGRWQAPEAFAAPLPRTEVMQLRLF